MLREGINLAPIDSGLVRALIPSHPIWGFRRREFSAARTTYQAEDIRALALGFLEALPATSRVSMFRHARAGSNCKDMENSQKRVRCNCTERFLLSSDPSRTVD